MNVSEESVSSPLVDLVARNVRRLMGDRMVSQTEVALWLGIAKTGASKRYRGLTPYTLHDLEVIAGHLGVPVTVFFEGVSAPFQGRGMNEAGRPEGRPAVVAGAGFEPATSGL